jgi:hypothetical protein
LSLPKDDAQSIEDLDFDALFEQTLFRSKSETSLGQDSFRPEEIPSPDT